MEKRIVHRPSYKKLWNDERELKLAQHETLVQAVADGLALARAREENAREGNLLQKRLEAKVTELDGLVRGNGTGLMHRVQRLLETRAPENHSAVEGTAAE